MRRRSGTRRAACVTVALVALLAATALAGNDFGFRPARAASRDGTRPGISDFGLGAIGEIGNRKSEIGKNGTTAAAPEPYSRDAKRSAPAPAATPAAARGEAEALRLAIDDLIATFGDAYPKGRDYLARLAAIEKAADFPETQRGQQLRSLRQEALLANPLLDFGRLLLVKRKPRPQVRGPGEEIGMPSNHECNSSLPIGGWDNEIAVLEPVRPKGRLRTLYRPEGGGYVGEIDLHPNADRLLFTQSDATNWTVWELALEEGAKAGRLRQVSRMPDDVDAFDACYLPDGGLMFCSTASFQAVPCWHGLKWVGNLYRMEADGSGVRQLCFDQDHDLHPTVLPNGQILYNRWDYTGIIHIYLRQLMLMNPDGTGQRAVYGSNSWFPNALYFTRPVPGETDRLITILSGYHGPHRMGRLVLLDTGRGWYRDEGIVHEFPRRGQPIEVAIRDHLVQNHWPLFLHPWPLGDASRPETCGKYFLVSCWMNKKASWDIYLVDVFDNMVLVRSEPGYALLEPVPLMRQPTAPAVPDRVDLSRDDGVVYLHDVYRGPGLAGVPRGTIKRLRVMAYHFGYRHMAGPDKVGRGGPWEVMRILGTVPVEADGSAVFRVPARVPVAFQALDGEGKAVQLMRSWVTLMPGETQSCVGCHEPLGNAPTVHMANAMNRDPVAIEPWYGPPRGFDFAREVQPVVDAYCVGCHDGSEKDRPDLRAEDQVPGYKGLLLSALGLRRLHPDLEEKTGGVFKYTPAYEALIPYLRRVGIEDDASLLMPGEYHADTSPLVQMMLKGHQGVRLDPQAWDRIVTWIDLNAPCHGTWHEVHPLVTDAAERRLAMWREYGGPRGDPEAVVETPRPAFAHTDPSPLPEVESASAEGWPFDAAEARRRQAEAAPHREVTVDLGDGVPMRLVRVPAGEFLMGRDGGAAIDERPATRVRIAEPFWMGATEITNAQVRRFDSAFTPGYYARRHATQDDQGLPLDGPDQPAVRVSWEQALGFCRWLSERTGRTFTLPTEAQWEWACRAGSDGCFYFGGRQADYTAFANVADEGFSRGLLTLGKQTTGGVDSLVLEGGYMADTRFNDGAVVTAPVGRYQPNAWGLHDMHGNAAEWTRSAYLPGAMPAGDGLDAPDAAGEKVARGGSFFDPPKRCRSTWRIGYPVWQRVFNVGFRVVCEEDSLPARLAAGGAASAE